MIRPYQGHYAYDEKNISALEPDRIGVYYCGYIDAGDGLLHPYYIGKSAQGQSLRDMLLSDLRTKVWKQVTHFGFRFCDTLPEAYMLEAQEIFRCQPMYNVAHKPLWSVSLFQKEPIVDEARSRPYALRPGEMRVCK